MGEMLYAADRRLFLFINGPLANPVTYAIMPALTDWNKSWIGLSIAAALIILLLWKGGKKGRIIALLLVPLIVMSDQLSSSVFKMIVQRPRPCHEIGGAPAVAGVRLLVPCGSGYSFPSSHAVNNFALAAFLSYYYRRWTGIFMLYASLMALSRVVVGVHYPSDIAAGALFGVCCAVVLIAAWREVGRLFPPLRIGPPGEGEGS